MDSATTDPRRVTAIVYLVEDDWDAAPDRDGGQLVWWNIEQGDPDAGSVARKHTLNPSAGQLCVFKARTIMHEVLPTHRKRFAVTLWWALPRGYGSRRGRRVDLRSRRRYYLKPTPEARAEVGSRG